MGLISFRRFTGPPFGQEQDVQSLAKLHNAAYPVLFRYIAFRVGDKAAAEQLTDELFALLLEKPRSDTQDADFPQKLLLSLATKAVRSYQQSSSHPAATPLTEAKIQSSLAALSEEHQIVLALRYGCRLSIEQVGQALNQEPEAARRLQARAIMALHAQMQCP